MVLVNSMSPSFPQVTTMTSESKEESTQHTTLNVEPMLALSAGSLEASARKDRTESPINW